LPRNLAVNKKAKIKKKAEAQMRVSKHLIAWLLFLICGIIYLAASVRDGDILMIAGSVCFLVAVILFLLPEK
jgi:predicted membrane channel-forming protein YqfA (hemolysin III family)